MGFDSPHPAFPKGETANNGNTKGHTMSAITTAQRTAILASAEAGILDSKLLDAIVNAPVAVPATPAPKAAAKPKAAVKSSRVQTVKPKAATIAPARKAAKPQTAKSAMSPNWNGKPMKSDAATITPGQIENLTTLGTKLGYEFDNIELYSMVDASNEYRAMQVEAGIAR
jgi:hypothetical protein